MLLKTGHPNGIDGHVLLVPSAGGRGRSSAREETRKIFIYLRFMPSLRRRQGRLLGLNTSSQILWSVYAG